MTITYLFAYFFTPAVFHFDIPILNVPFARFAEVLWACKFFINIKLDIYLIFLLVSALCTSVPISIKHIQE
jgi:hypothetical protein